MDFRPVSRQTTNPLRSSATPVKTMNPSSTIFYFTIFFFLLRLLSIFNSYSIFMSFYICFNTWEIRNWILYILNFCYLPKLCLCVYYYCHTFMCFTLGKFETGPCTYQIVLSSPSLCLLLL